MDLFGLVLCIVDVCCRRMLLLPVSDLRSELEGLVPPLVVKPGPNLDISDWSWLIGQSNQNDKFVKAFELAKSCAKLDQKSSKSYGLGMLLL